jgi:3-phosphoshikimate 1-carboxyvinyltransferase
MIEIKPLLSLDSEITVPGSKYLANRVLLIAALAEGTSKIKNLPSNDDIDAMLEAIQKFGIKINQEKGEVSITGSNGKLNSPDGKIDVRNSGTLMRFISGFSSLAKGKSIITGSPRIQQRPIQGMLDSLNDLGIVCRSLNSGYPPIEIIGGTLEGGKTKVSGSISSQYVSSLLLVSPYAKNDVEIFIESDLVSIPYVEMTIDLMKKFGVEVINEEFKKFTIKSDQRYKAGEYLISSDWSTANYFLAAAAIVPGRIKVQNLDFNQKGESGFYKVLESMGCRIIVNPDSLELRGNESLKAIDIDMSSMPDSVLTLAAVSAYANGTTKMTGISNLKYKESDRIKDTVTELKKMGIDAVSGEDFLSITGGTPKNAIIDPHNDHRMAMSFSLIGLRSGIKILNPNCVSKSFPDFWKKIEQIGAEIKPVKNIVLIGYRGSGKTSTSRYLNSRLQRGIISIDSEIEKKVGNIKTFVKNQGWKKFREIESSVIKGLSATGLIIDAGGGIVENPENLMFLKSNSTIIWLKASPSQIRKRIKNSGNRPSLTDGKSFLDEIEEVLEKRVPEYMQSSDFQVDTDSKTPKQVGDEILELIKNEL